VVLNPAGTNLAVVGALTHPEQTHSLVEVGALTHPEQIRFAAVVGVSPTRHKFACNPKYRRVGAASVTRPRKDSTADPPRRGRSPDLPAIMIPLLHFSFHSAILAGTYRGKTNRSLDYTDSKENE
jgi:hypothetical protein